MQIPNYGGASLDENEKAAMRLPVNFVIDNKITGVETKYESILCNTKSRWRRKETGSPEDRD